MLVEVGAEDRSCTVTTPDDLDQVLDDVTSTAGVAVLVKLRALGAVLHIGIGLTDRINLAIVLLGRAVRRVPV